MRIAQIPLDGLGYSYLGYWLASSSAFLIIQSLFAKAPDWPTHSLKELIFLSSVEEREELRRSSLRIAFEKVLKDLRMVDEDL